jgi:prevent-host-death family protein
MKSVGVAEAKAKLSELLGRVFHAEERIVIERRGKPMAALVPMKDLAKVQGDTERDWLDDVLGMCADCPEFCDELDKIVAERRAEMPRDVEFPWDDQR